jgi:hypothetical protein
MPSPVNHRLADRFSLLPLRERSLSHLLGHFSSVHMLNTFLELPSALLAEVMGSDALANTGEEAILDALLRWAEHDDSGWEEDADQYQ